MNLKNLFGTTLIAASLATASLSPAQAAPVPYEIDMSHTNALFDVSHLGFTTMLGRFGELEGTLAFDEENIENSKVDIVIKTASIDTFHQKRDDHLRSPDFFNTAEFPEMTFSSTEVVKTGDQSAKLIGDLTLLGVTHPVELDLVVNKVGVHPFNKKHVAGFTATGIIKRSQFGMTFGVPMIGDEIALRLELEGVRQ